MSSGSSSSDPANDNDVVIVAAVRTPLCRSRNKSGGGLVGVPISDLFQAVLTGLLERSDNKVTAADIEDICVGTVLTPPAGFAALRMAQDVAGLSPATTPLRTVNRQCASGLQAVADIAAAIQAGQIRIGIGAGVESMSLYPMHKMKPPVVNWDEMKLHRTAMDCLLPMGITSDTVVQKYGLKRHELDAFAVRSHQKAAAAQQAGKFVSEIVPVQVTRKVKKKKSPNDDKETKTVVMVTQDDGIRPTTSLKVLSKLKPAFTPPTGATTAGNSSQTTDGAAACLLMTRAEARRRNLPIAAVWHGFATAAVPPAVMGIGPAVAIPAVLQQCGLTVDDMDVFEINEAFASQAAWCVQELQLPAEKVNPVGGAIALGHPLGCTGARLIATLLPELHRRRAAGKSARYGVVSMCIGTGMGAAAVLEVEPSQSQSAVSSKL